MPASEFEVLYHYTSIAGLNGILRSRKVWASDCRYLNDQKELVDATGQFIKRFDKEAKSVLELAFRWHESSRAHCVFSLSKSPKVLSQWRAYAQDGKGAAIGFDRRYIEGRANSFSRFLVDCVYHEHDLFLDELKDKYTPCVDGLVEMYNREPATNAFWTNIDENPAALESLYSELLRMKNSAFYEEQEVRLVINCPLSMVSTRVAGDLMVPYVEHEFVKATEEHMWCVVPEIWLGPKCDKRNVNSLKAFRQFGWGRENAISHFDCGYV